MILGIIGATNPIFPKGPGRYCPFCKFSEIVPVQLLGIHVVLKLLGSCKGVSVSRENRAERIGNRERRPESRREWEGVGSELYFGAKR